MILGLREVCHILQISKHRREKIFGSQLHALATWGDVVPTERRPLTAAAGVGVGAQQLAAAAVPDWGGRLLHMSKSALLGLPGSGAMHCIDG